VDKIAVFFCKNFLEVVRKAQCKEPVFLETKHSLIDGLFYWNGKSTCQLISQQFAKFMDLMTVEGYTVTDFVRVSDFAEVVPITEQFQKTVAMMVNKRIFAEAFPEALPN
jgi:hypothetical protein